MRTVVLDFETFYDTKDKYSLRTKGSSNPDYILDPRFKVHGLAVNLEVNAWDGSVHGLHLDDKGSAFLRPEEIPAFLETIKDDITITHNGYFDLLILKMRYGFTPAYTIDTLQLANHVLGSAYDGGEKNDLAHLAERLGLPTRKGDLSFLNGVRDLDEALFLALGSYAKNDAVLTRQVLDALLPSVSNPDFELWLADHTLRIYTEKPLAVNPAKVRKAIEVVQARLQERREAAGVDPKVLSSNPQFAAELKARLAKHKLKLPMKKGKHGMIPALAKTDPGFMRLLQSGIPEVVNLIRGRLVERSATNALARLKKLEKYNALGGLRTHLVYYGAHTGRYAGGGGFNVQNLTSPDRATDPVDREIASLIRECIVADLDLDGNPADETFALVDAAQIEARVLAWLAGQQDILDTFASGADLYSQFIGETAGREVRKPVATDTPEEARVLKFWRFIGKESILGLGFQMAAEKFETRLRDPKHPAEVTEMLDAGLLDTTALVETYRAKYPEIVRFWWELQRAFMSAKDGATRRVGKLLLKKAGPRAVQIVLPSGRSLYYRNIRSVPGFDKQGKPKMEWKHGSGQKLYGGLLAENVTQAVARDILVEAIHDAEMAGYPVVMSIHDEIVARVPKAKGQEAHDFLIDALSTPPSWGAGLVLAAEGRVAPHLGK